MKPESAVISAILLTVTTIVVTAAGCSSQTKSERVSYDVDAGTQESTESIVLVPLYVSTLDSLKPYVHNFYTGFSVSAPAMDPREFMNPDELSVALSDASPEKAPPCNKGLPKRSFRVLGEVRASCSPKVTHHGGWSNKPAVTHLYETDVKGPHGRYFCTFEPGSGWEQIIRKLHTEAATWHADALIEVVCGAALSATRYDGKWSGGAYMSIPVLNESGGVEFPFTPTYTLPEYDPPRLKFSGWQISALAVVWLDDEEVREASSPERN